jgi:hypothetical protein
VTYLAAFALAVALDLAWVWCVRAVGESRPMHAALTSGAIQLLSLGSVLLVVEDHRLLIPNVLGHAVGAYLGTSRRKY